MVNHGNPCLGFALFRKHHILQQDARSGAQALPTRERRCWQADRKGSQIHQHLEHDEYVHCMLACIGSVFDSVAIQLNQSG